MRVAVGLEYDGRGFCGWQSQASACGVQDALEQALSVVHGGRVRVIGAGRTDSGVHASAQVAHFDAVSERPMTAWVRGTNAQLPAGVAVLWALAVDAAFHARYSAIGRAYTYLLLNRASRPGLTSGRVGWFHRPLDVERMHAAAQSLLGTHDFSAFRAAECQADSPVKELRRFDIERQGDLIVFHVAASAFLHKMVRNLIGSLVYVGKGKYPPAWMGELLAGKDRTRAAPTFAPDGLYLSAVEYDSAWMLPRVPSSMPVFLN